MKVEVDTNELRAVADAELAHAQDRHAAELRIIERIEAKTGPRPSAQPMTGDATEGEWNGIRNAIRVYGKTVKAMTATEALKFIASKFSGVPTLTEKQIAGALRKMTDVGELNRLSPATASKSAVYEINQSAKEDGLNEKAPAQPGAK